MLRRFLPDLKRSAGPLGLTLVVCVLGVMVGEALHLPAPFLTGPAALATIAALAGLPMIIPVALRDAVFMVIGIGMGTGVTPEVLVAARDWPFSLLCMTMVVLTVLYGGAWVLRRQFRYDHNTAVLASAPGHLSFVLGLSADINADVRSVAIVQSLRLLVLTLAVPALAIAFTETDLTALPQPVQAMALWQLGATLALAVFVGWAFKRLNLPAAYLLAGLGLSTLGHGSGLTSGSVPPWIAAPAFAVMGTLIGTRFSGVRWVEVRAAVGAATVLSVIATLAALAAAWPISVVLDMPIYHVLIAIAPGGLETMAALGILMGADPAFVALHHVARLLVLSVLIPLAIRR